MDHVSGRKRMTKDNSEWTFPSEETKKALYGRQNKAIHTARAQLGMNLDECRELARRIGGKPSISSLNLAQRRELIDVMKSRGANVHNPPLPKAHAPSRGRRKSRADGPAEKGLLASRADDGLLNAHEKPEELYQKRLDYWHSRFPKERPDFASNAQLAWIEALWLLDFDDGRTTWRNGLRGFIFRQTRNLKNGPVSDLAFLRKNHVAAVLTPLKAKAEERQELKKMRRGMK